MDAGILEDAEGSFKIPRARLHRKGKKKKVKLRGQ